MIRSMTAFAKHQLQSNIGIATWEIRSVNNRFLDVNFRLPENLRDIEFDGRKLVKEYCQRGKLDIYLRFVPAENATAELRINQALLRQLSSAVSMIDAQLEHPGHTSAGALLRYPGLVETAEIDMEGVKKELLSSFTDTLKILTQVRDREGSALTEVILERLNEMEKELEPVKSNLSEILLAQRGRLEEKLSTILAAADIDEARLAQEMVYVAQKIDIEEELDRLSVHINEYRRMLKKGGSVGRHLDFLAQELHREANTMGSKSVHAETTQAAINLKVLIEQVREQVQNIE